MQPSRPDQRTTARLGTVHAPDVPSVGDLLAGVEVMTSAGPWQSTRVTSVACQLHKLEPDGLWFAVPPGTTEEKIRLAIRRGASAVVADCGAVLPERTSVPVVRVRDVRAALAKASAAFFGSPAQDLRLVGVTGTNGKGTVALLLRSMLEADEVGGWRRAGVPGPAIVTAVRAAGLPPGRFERVEAGQDFEIVIDHAHTPGAVLKIGRKRHPQELGAC